MSTFTLKYRTSKGEEYLEAGASDVHAAYDSNGRLVVSAKRHDDTLITYGPFMDPPETVRIHPVLWVMNDHGATVAKYDLFLDGISPLNTGPSLENNDFATGKAYESADQIPLPDPE